MKKPYIFGHRGAMGYEIENTMKSFKKGIELGAGIETDVRLTRDGETVCFHDPGFEVGKEYYLIQNMSLKELKEFPFNDGRYITTLKEVFETFQNDKERIRYSCDIGNRQAGETVIKLAEKYKIINYLEITDTKPRILFQLRRFSDKANLVHTIPYSIPIINSKSVKFEKLLEHNVFAVNIKFDRAKLYNFKEIIDNGLKCYVWGVNYKVRMKKILQMKYKDEIVEAIYTDYPDVLIKLRDEIFS